ncbi:hypothetical protein C2845_PM09G02980 [Panicum miliaceum]|uniref:Tryptophan synthase beta chain-like PALP domain-containing protein n=1 Tax=Panicum miliaceum TaxID=4540 RepID=A0A3L6RYP1_PANMI|nr:hypothetical protein C2845_PM09G02980 [Panicum miliaceum]
MEAALRGIRGKLTEHREKVISALLLGSFLALGWRSAEQQREIEDLEAEKNSLRAANASMSTAMWAWREELFSLAVAPSSPIPVSRLRHIYGEEEVAPPAAHKQPGSLNHLVLVLNHDDVQNEFILCRNCENTRMYVWAVLYDRTGWTPLIEVKRIAQKDEGNARIIGKLECYQPLCSVKDRSALRMVEDAEEKGLISPGVTTLVEPTSGNMGIGLAYIAVLRGYRFLAVMPAEYSFDKQILLRYLGAEGQLDKVEQLNKEIPNVHVLDQFANAANPEAHFTWRPALVLGDLPAAASYPAGPATLTRRRRAIPVHSAPFPGTNSARARLLRLDVLHPTPCFGSDPDILQISPALLEFGRFSSFLAASAAAASARCKRKGRRPLHPHPGPPQILRSRG